MSFIKRAGLYCLRQRFKTAVLFLLLTLISTFMLIGIAVRDASQQASANVGTAVGGKIMLELDTEGHMGLTGQSQWGETYSYTGDYITREIVDSIAKVNGVVGYNTEDTAAYYGAGVNFKYLPAAFGLSYTPYGESSAYTATLSSEKCADFERGKYSLVDGRHITPEDKHVCLISKELADYNSLSVGDKIKMYSLDSDSVSEFEVVGIFDGTEGSAKNALTVDEILANCGYIDCASLFELFEDELNGYQQLTIYVEDPVGVQQVYDRISALPELKGKSLKLTIGTDEYDVVSSPLESMKALVNTAIVIISVVSTAILTLLLTIRIRGRKREIGILLSVGKSKANIILQFFTETFSVAVLSFATSVPLAGLTAEKACRLLSSAAVNVKINLAYLPPLCMTEMILITVSVLISSWSVVRLKPKDILSKMS